jgi:hypothetical protein
MRCLRLSELLARAGIIVIVCLAFGQSQATEPEKPAETTVCELVAHCKKFDGKRVQFRASVRSDWFEHTALVDSQCEAGVVPRTSGEADKRPDVDAFNRAMDEGKPGNTDLHISAVFTGRFVCKAASKSPRDRRVIEIDRVDALDVTRTKPADR